MRSIELKPQKTSISTRATIASSRKITPRNLIEFISSRNQVISNDVTLHFGIGRRETVKILKLAQSRKLIQLDENEYEKYRIVTLTELSKTKIGVKRVH